MGKNTEYCGVRNVKSARPGASCVKLAGHRSREHRDMAGDEWIDTRACPICGTNCSGCLEDLAAKQEGLRELLSYCRSQSEIESLVDNEQYNSHLNGLNEAYADVARRLAPLLDGEA